MRCRAFDQRLDDLLDRRESPNADSLLQAHASCCPRCSTLLHAHGQLLTTMNNVSLPVVVNKTTSAEHLPANPVGLTLAVLTLLGVAAWFCQPAANQVARVSGHLPNVPQARLSVEHHPSAASVRRVDTDRENSPTTIGSVAAIHHPLLGLQLLSQTDWTNTFASVTAAIGPAVEVPRLETRWMTAVAHEMAPVHKSMSSTLNFLRRTLSSSTEKTSSIDG